MYKLRGQPGLAGGSINRLSFVRTTPFSLLVSDAEPTPALNPHAIADAITSVFFCTVSATPVSCVLRPASAVQPSRVSQHAPSGTVAADRF